MNQKLCIALVVVGLLVSVPAYAHVVVKPAEVGLSEYTNFVVGVPVEKEVPTIGLRLVIPGELQYVTPNVKPGWKISIKKDGTGHEAKVTEIEWTGGVIPAGQRDEFIFSAKTPSEETKLVWKAYQTYQGGEVVAWDTETGDNPYSVTKALEPIESEQTSASGATGTWAFVVALMALILSALAIRGMRMEKKIR